MSKLKAKDPAATELKKCVLCLRSIGFSVPEISKKVPKSHTTIYRLISPEYADSCKRSAARWTDQNKQAAKSISRNWYLNNKGRHHANVAQWRKNNRHKAAEYENKALQNPERKIASNLRRRMRSVIFNNKFSSFVALTGCSTKLLVAHLESQFKPGMSWANYGVHGWHIDHIKPISKFNIFEESEQQKAFHFSNLQPLWAEENIRKHNK